MATRVFHVPYVQACDALELRAIVSRCGADDTAGETTVVPDVETLLADSSIELVVVATPTATHAALARQALKAGRHVVVEKPFTLHPGEARDLVELARSNGRILSVFHNQRRDSDFLAIRDAIERGRIGRVVHFESHIDRYRPEVRDRWREDGSPGSGIWYDLGPHLVDQALLLFGRPQAISAGLGQLACWRRRA